MSGNRYLEDLAGRPKIKGKSDIKAHLRIMKINNWTKCSQDRVKWQEVIQKAKTSKR
jgi:hypothetical protein